MINIFDKLKENAINFVEIMLGLGHALVILY